MAKPKAPATEAEVFAEATEVESLQNNDFSQPILEADTGPRGSALQEQMDAIRTKRDAERRARGPAKKKRQVTNYHDAERLRNLALAGHTHLVTPEELVDFEEAGLLPDPSHYATGTSALSPRPAPQQGSIVPPAEAEPA